MGLALVSDGMCHLLMSWEWRGGKGVGLHQKIQCIYPTTSPTMASSDGVGEGENSHSIPLLGRVVDQIQA